MEKLSIEKICNYTKGRLKSSQKDLFIENIVIDSREATSKSLFIPIIGKNHDGHDFMESAYNLGCRNFLCDKDHEFDKDDINIVFVKDTTEAFGLIAKEYKKSLNILSVAITGSVGKTSTKDIIFSVISQKYKTLKTIGNLNNDIGVPKTLLNLDSSYETSVIEMGMDKKGEINYLTNLVNPDIAIITNIGMSHIMNFPNGQEGIFKAKMEIVNGLKENGLLIVNGDDEYLKTLKDKNHSYKLLTYGFQDDNDICCKKYEVKDNLINFTCIYNKKEYNFSISSLAKHNIGNAMIAILIGFKLGLNKKEIEKGLESIEFTQNRLEVIKTDNYIVIDDSYNSSYDSVMSALEVLNSFKERKVAILGDIFELGSYSESVHKKIGKNIKCDILITIGENAENIYDEAKSRGIRSYYFKEKKDFYKEFKNILLKDDVILVKASNGMKFKEIVNFLREDSFK
ncbi:MAG: UDP-N-acetylmuramoyl-tripeptide--D-alanyl-D-alanine ligase [Bacilli bacterium]